MSGRGSRANFVESGFWTSTPPGQNESMAYSVDSRFDDQEKVL